MTHVSREPECSAHLEPLSPEVLSFFRQLESAFSRTDCSLVASLSIIVAEGQGLGALQDIAAEMHSKLTEALPSELGHIEH